MTGTRPPSRASGTLYDLLADPYETRNLIHEPTMNGVERELRAELAKLVLDALGIQE